MVLTFVDGEWKDMTAVPYSLILMVKTDQPSDNWGATQRAALAAKHGRFQAIY